MVVEVKYQTKRDATAEYTDFTQTEYFETNTIPDKPTIVRKLLAMGVDFAEDTVLISAYIDDGDGDTLMRGGFRITEL
jgi:hypothetical protein